MKNVINAQFVSVWDDGVEIKTSCRYCKSSNTAFDIEIADINGVEILQEQYVELPDGTQIHDFNTEEDDELSASDIDELKRIFNNK